ncbi:chorismate lyase [Marinomonas sp. M1K-6]|uniref:Probable chorismate pyruvate-lyase n=1 Tax=Marinomonas profundi TaxID=2726122 RepID=A0A847R0T0_9GAMM|nr:chorismate lyase [Marinomonas profundi]NLQ17211.1 chorismate lyase [Marinomonas profundi]UDV04597.1 chorismate lyase [Marinomonas profundi]
MTIMNPLAAQQFDYRWAPIHRVNKTKAPKTLWPWLITHASLTTKLQSLGELTVEVIEDAWGTPTSREKKRLNLRPREAARIRTVLLKVDGKAVIYARSIIPARSLQGHWRQVKHLKNKPLGGYLFQHRSLIRSPIEVTQLPKRMFPDQHTALWARRSVFHQYGPGILVNEAFFDEINQLKTPFGLL